MDIPIKCEFCGENLALQKCLDCPKALCLCDGCFVQAHTSESKKGHKSKPINLESPKQIDDGLCSKHDRIPMKYFCTDCQKFICSECIISEKHDKHTYIIIKDKENDIAKMIQKEIIIGKENLQRISRIEKTAQNLTDGIGKSLNNYKPQLIESFNKMHQEIEEKKKEIMKNIESYEEIDFNYLKNLSFEASNLKSNIEIQLKILEEYNKSYSISLYKNLALLQQEIRNLPKFEEKIEEFEKKISSAEKNEN